MADPDRVLQQIDRRIADTLEELRILRVEHAAELRALREASEARGERIWAEFRVQRDVANEHLAELRAMRTASDVQIDELRAMRAASDVQIDELRALRATSDLQTEELRQVSGTNMIQTDALRVLLERIDRQGPAAA